MTRAFEEPYKAYAVTPDGTRVLLDAVAIVIDLGHSEVQLDLVARHPILAGQLHIAASETHLLIVGHGDACSVYVGVEPFDSRESRLRPT